MSLVLGLNSDKSKAKAIALMKPAATFADFEPLARILSKNRDLQVIVTDRDLTAEEQEIANSLNVSRVIRIDSEAEATKFWRDLVMEMERKKYGPGSYDDKVRSLSFPMSSDAMMWLSREILYGQKRQSLSRS